MAATAPAPNDWLAHPELLPPRPQTFTETKYLRLFAVDLQGRSQHDQYVFLAPNGLAVVGLAPSHPLIAAHRRATGYKPCPLQFIPPQLEHLDAHELAAAAVDEDAGEEGDAGAAAGGRATGAEGGPDGAQGDGGDGDGDADGTEFDNGDAAGADAAEEAEGQGAAAAGTAGDAGRPAEGQDKPGTSEGADGGRSRGTGGTQLDGTSRTWRQRQAHVVEPFAKSDIARINFDAGAVRNRAASKASGRKRHRGPPPLQGSALLARIERKPLPLPPPAPEDAAGKGAAEAGAAAEGSKGEEAAAGAADAATKAGKDAQGSGTNAPKHPPSFPVWVVSGGQLLEVNERLAADPGLLLERPCREGYLALLYPTKEQAAGLRRRLLSEEQYLALRGLTAEDLL